MWIDPQGVRFLAMDFDAKALKDLGIDLAAQPHTVLVHFRGSW